MNDEKSFDDFKTTLNPLQTVELKTNFIKEPIESERDADFVAKFSRLVLPDHPEIARELTHEYCTSNRKKQSVFTAYSHLLRLPSGFSDLREKISSVSPQERKKFVFGPIIAAYSQRQKDDDKRKKTKNKEKNKRQTPNYKSRKDRYEQTPHSRDGSNTSKYQDHRQSYTGRSKTSSYHYGSQSCKRSRSRSRGGAGGNKDSRTR